jgi:hypothetical protein
MRYGLLGLALKPAATRLAPTTEGVAFLGLRVYPGCVHLPRKTRTRLVRRILEAIPGPVPIDPTGHPAWNGLSTRLGHLALADDTLELRRNLVARLEP